jgi:hypothetical protein
VVAINAAGGSTPTVTVTPVTPCTLNTVAEFGTKNGVVGSNFNQSINTTGATGKGTATGLPPGLQAFSFEGGGEKGIEISGVPTASGTYKFEIPLTGGCGTVKATGTIVVEATPPPLCKYTRLDIVPIYSEEVVQLGFNVFNTELATKISDVSGLPQGTSLEWVDNKIILKGTPMIGAGNYNYAFILEGDTCTDVQVEGTITVVQRY